MSREQVRHAEKARRISPNTRSLEEMERRGYMVDIVERRVGPITKDLFGIADLVAVGPDIVAIQATTSSHVSNRVHKIARAEGVLAVLRKAGIRVVVHGWRQRKRDGAWVVREVDLS